MKNYQVEIKETLSKIVTIEAESEKDAFAKVAHAYRDQKIILDADDFVETEFNVIK